MLEARNHQFKTYYSYHVKKLSIKQLTYNPCLIYSKEPFNVIGLQTNNTLFVKDVSFAKKEQVKLKKARFMAKEREHFTYNYNLKFNKGIIHLKNDKAKITLTQER